MRNFSSNFFFQKVAGTYGEKKQAKETSKKDQLNEISLPLMDFDGELLIEDIEASRISSSASSAKYEEPILPQNTKKVGSFWSFLTMK